MKKTFTKIGLLAIAAIASAFSPAFAGDDAAVTKLSVANTYVGVSSSDLIKGSIQNNGTTVITAYTIFWSVNGATPQSQSFTANLAVSSSTNFILAKKLARATVGTYNVKLWVANVNGTNADVNNANDTLNTAAYFFDKNTAPHKNMVVEEGTGTWCGWCVRGHVYMDSIANAYPNNTVLIAVHNGDPMTVAAYDAGMSTIISGYPSAVFNRSLVGDPSDVFTQYANNSNNFGLADLTFNATVSPTTRVVTGNVSAKFALPATGDFRFIMVITEDGITGTGSGYDQHNYYSYQSQNIALRGAGHNWQAEPQIVPASQMVYNHVARQLVGGFTGVAGSLPTTMNAGSTYNYTLKSSALPVGTNMSNIQVHILIIDAANNKIYNGASSSNLPPTGINDIKAAVDNLTTYPNPSQNELTVSFGLDKVQKVNISIVNALGETVKTQVAENIVSGKNEVKVNTSDLAKGLYFIEVGTSEGVVSHKFIKVD